MRKTTHLIAILFIFIFIINFSNSATIDTSGTMQEYSVGDVMVRNSTNSLFVAYYETAGSMLMVAISDDDGKTWRNSSSTGLANCNPTSDTDKFDLLINSTDDLHLFCRDVSSGDTDTVFSNNSGFSWSSPVEVFGDGAIVYTRGGAIVDSNDNIILCGGTGNQIWVANSSNSGQSWTVTQDIFSANGIDNGCDIEVDSSGMYHLVGYDMGLDDFYYSNTTNLTSWGTAILIDGYDSIQQNGVTIKIDPTDEEIFILTQSDNVENLTLFNSSDGQSWTVTEIPLNRGDSVENWDMEIEDDGDIHSLFTVAFLDDGIEEIHYINSSDGGITWSSSIEVTQYDSDNRAVLYVHARGSRYPTFNNVNLTKYVEFVYWDDEDNILKFNKIDIFPPIINIVSPTNNTNSSDNGLDVNITTDDFSVYNCWWTENVGTTNTTFTCDNNVTTQTWTDGTHSLVVYVNDTSGNIASDSVIFTTDATPPSLSINIPLNQTYTTIQTAINYTVSDATIGLDTCWFYNITDGTNTTITCGINITDLTASQGTNTWYVYANDSLNNLNTTSVTFFVDSIFPEVSVLFPTNNTNHTSNTIGINVSVNDTNIQSCLWTNNSGTTNHTLTCGNNITGQTWDEGYNDVFIYVNDTLNNLNSTHIKFFIDSVSPVISITNPPANETFYNNQAVDVNYTLVEINQNNCWWTNNSGVTNNSITCGTNITGKSWAEGQNNFTIWANDTSGNIASESITFIIDTISPLITITFPANNSNFSTNSLEINYTYSELNTDSCWWTNNSGKTNYSLTSCGTNITGKSWAEGLNNITIYINDSANNLNYSHLRFTIDTISPNLAIIEPQNITYTTIQTIINSTQSDSGVGLETCWYSTDSGATNTSFTCGTNVSGLSSGEGSSIWYVWANDTLNNINTTSITFFIDSINPNVDIVYPTNNSKHSTNNIEINVSINDTNLANCWWTNNSGTTNHTLSCGNNITGNIWDEGDTQIYLYANDTLGNINSTHVNFTIDTIVPIVTILAPTEGYVYDYNTSIDINYSTSDAITSVSTCWFNVDDGANKTIANCVNDSMNVSDGSHTLNFFVNDSLNNINKTIRNFVVSLDNPAINLIYPRNNTYFNYTQNIYFNYTATDSNGISTVYLYHDFNGSFSLNHTNEGVTSALQNLTTYNISNDGNYSWTIWANDSTNSGGFAQKGNYTLVIDTTFPNVSITNVVTTTNSQTVTFNHSINDTNLKNCWYNVTTSTGTSEIGKTSITCNSQNTLFVVSDYSTYTLNIFGNDSAGNINLTSQSFTTRQVLSSPSPGGGGGDTITISAIGIQPAMNISQKTDLQKCILYARIRESCGSKINCVLTDIQKENTTDILEDQNVEIDLIEFDKWLDAYNKNEVMVFKVLETDVNRFNLFTDIIQLEKTPFKVIPSRLDPFPTFLLSQIDSLSFRVDSEKVLKNVSILQGSDKELSVNITGQTTSNVFINLVGLDFSSRVFKGTASYISSEDESVFQEINIRVINLRNLNTIIAIVSIFGGIVLLILLRKKIGKIIKNFNKSIKSIFK